MIALFIIFSTCTFPGCGSRDPGLAKSEDSAANRKKNKVQPLPGQNERLLKSEIEKGQVLVAYSDCLTCHTTDIKAKGPSFRDIAMRYPANDGYINLLARKIITGGSGIWGYPVMTPHPELSEEHAKLMVKYILSLER